MPETRFGSIFSNVDELSRDYRVDGDGAMSRCHLLGQLSISGYESGRAEQAIADAYSENYLRNPQVSVSVTEFRSQQFTAIGALTSPRIYNIERRVTLMEAIAMAGGLAGNAGTQIYLTDRVRDARNDPTGHAQPDHRCRKPDAGARAVQLLPRRWCIDQRTAGRFHLCRRCGRASRRV